MHARRETMMVLMQAPITYSLMFDQGCSWNMRRIRTVSEL